jgi:hypothetical protein
MRHAPFFTQPAPIEFNFEADWATKLRTSQPETVRLDDEVIERLRYEIWCFAGELHINQQRVDTKAVAEQLDKICTRAKRVLEASSIIQGAMWIAKLSEALKPPQSPETDTERARLIAIDRIALKFFAVEQMRAGSPLTTPRIENAYQCLARQEWTDANLRRLCKFVDQAKDEVARDNEQTRQSVLPAVGKLIINRKPLQYSDDPARERGFDPKGVAIAAFVQRMVLVYRWMGGTTKIHRHWEGEGSPAPTPFMNFLSAISAAVPPEFRPKGTSLHSRAHAHIQIEKAAASTEVA